MRKPILSFVLLLCLGFGGSVSAQSTMTDQQVLEYAMEGMKAGKDQRVIASELAAGGLPANRPNVSRNFTNSRRSPRARTVKR